MIQAIIIEDEVVNQENIIGLLSIYCKDKVHVAGVAGDVDGGRELILKVKPDLIFLDVELSLGTGFDILDSLTERNFEVIFITAFEQYAIKAFRFAALDYLLKPLDPDQLVQAVNRAAGRIKDQVPNQRLETLMHNRAQAKPEDHTIALSWRGGAEFVRTHEILRCEADGNYTTFYLTDGRKIVNSRNLKEYEDILEGYRFARVHHSHLVNLRKVKRFLSTEGNYLELEDGSRVPVSRRKKGEVKKMWEESQ